MTESHLPDNPPLPLAGEGWGEGVSALSWAKNETPQPDDPPSRLTPERGFGIYIHWPFCLSKCPYCDFNSHVRDHVDHTQWRAALRAELRFMRDWAQAEGHRPLTSVFFGGGTPSLMDPATVAALIADIYQDWDCADDLEITLEANPATVDAARFQDFAAAGVNRVSLGVQALHNHDLQMLGRRHDVAEAIAGITAARAAFRRVSFDLIYARPGQQVADWRAEMLRALELGCDHLSLYQLTIEAGTQFHTLYQRGALVLPDDDLAGDLFEVTQQTLADHHMPAYEISNHAAPGQESRHNLVYWRYGDYLGIGPGAHGRLTTRNGVKIATRTHRAPEIWLDRVQQYGHGLMPLEAVPANARYNEVLMMGLRLAEGVPLARLTAETGQHIADDRAKKLIDAGYLEIAPTHVRATHTGRQRLNAVLTHLLT